MKTLIIFYLALGFTGTSHAFPFLWPSFFGSTKTSTTVTTTTTHAGGKHPHAHSHQGHMGGIITSAVTGQPHSSHLHIRPAISVADAYLASRPLPPHLMGSPYHHHHHHHRPVLGSNTHLHVHGGTIASSDGVRGHHHHHQHHPHLHHLSRSVSPLTHPHVHSTFVHAVA